MKYFLGSLLFWGCMQLSTSLPVEELPGFTPWSNRKRDVPRALSSTEFSGDDGVFDTARFGVPDPTCRKKLPDKGCDTMDKFTVQALLANRQCDFDAADVPCLFYTSDLSGAAERTAGFVLWDVLVEGAREKQTFKTIWQLLDKTYYPRKDRLGDTPKLRCVYQDVEDNDMRQNHNGCQRLYFMSMSKAMAKQCKGEVFLMTMTDLAGNKEVPENGIWWQVEFPTLIDPNRENKITKITYIQVPEKSTAQIKQMKKSGVMVPPEQKHRGEYWPVGPGKNHLNKRNPAAPAPSSAVTPGPAANTGATQQKRDLNMSESEKDVQMRNVAASVGFVKRADAPVVKICEPKDNNKDGEGCYPYAHSIPDMFESYKDIVW